MSSGQRSDEMKCIAVLFLGILSSCPDGKSDAHCPYGDCSICTNCIEWLNRLLFLKKLKISFTSHSDDRGIMNVTKLSSGRVMAKREGFRHPYWYKQNFRRDKIGVIIGNKKKCTSWCNDNQQCEWFIHMNNGTVEKWGYFRS